MDRSTGGAGVAVRIAGVLRALALPLLLAYLYETYARIVASQSDALAPLSKALWALGASALDGTLWQATGFTLMVAFSGLALGGGLGIALGIVLGLWRAAADAAFLSVEVFRPVPSVALIPLAMLVFGFGVRMELSIVAFACFWPLLVLTQAAVRQVPPQLLEVARVLGFSPARQVVKFVLPSIVPRMIVALRLGVAIALVVAVTVEIAANPNGLGYGLILAQQSLQPELMIGWLLWIGVLGYAVNAGAERLRIAVARRMGVAP